MNALKYVLIFATGALAGGGVSALFFKKKYEKFYKEKADQELEQMDLYYQQMMSHTEDIEADEETEEEYREVATEPAPKRKGSFATDYGKFYGKDGKEDPAESEHPEEEQVRERREPRVIRADQFGSNGYSQRELYYYTDDDDLYPEGEGYDEVIDTDEVKDMIGNALIKYGFADEGNLDRDMYVRNFDRKTDYHITKVIGSRSEEEYGG